MAKKVDSPRIAKIKIAGALRERLEGIEAALKERGVKQVSLSEIVERLLVATDSKLHDDIVDDLTPLDYKLKVALSDERKKKQILRILNSRSSSEQSAGALEEALA